jgi:hypothetical protein
MVLLSIESLCLPPCDLLSAGTAYSGNFIAHQFSIYARIKDLLGNVKNSELKKFNCFAAFSQFQEFHCLEPKFSGTSKLSLIARRSSLQHRITRLVQVLAAFA